MPALDRNYRTSFLRCALLIAAGTTLQFMTGGIDSGFLHYPWGLVLAVNYVYLLILAYSFSSRYRWLRTLWDDRACISSSVTLLLLVIVFGLVRQEGSENGPAGVLGFSSMRSSWIFCIVLFYFMTALGIRSVAELDALFRRIFRRRPFPGFVAVQPFHGIRRAAVTLIHLCVFLILLAGMFGSGDKIRCRLTAHQGVPVGMAMTGDGRSVGLPFVLVLKDFSIDEYPPRLYVYDGKAGVPSREFLSAGEDGAEASVEGWSLRADTVLLSAGKMPADDRYVPSDHVGAMPAVLVSARNEVSGVSRRGWVSCGSHVFGSSSLDLGEGSAVVMPYPQARRYTSEVGISRKDGEEREYVIEVNHPVRIGAWRIYQSGYDTDTGRWSTVSILECVRDPWFPVVRISLWMILVSAAVIAVAAGGSRAAGILSGGVSCKTGNGTFREEGE